MGGFSIVGGPLMRRQQLVPAARGMAQPCVQIPDLNASLNVPQLTNAKSSSGDRMPHRHLYTKMLSQQRQLQP
jgi:hypothetical protein